MDARTVSRATAPSSLTNPEGRPLIQPTPFPPQLLSIAASARRIVEVGAGFDFSTALALTAAAPQARLLVTDVDSRVLSAPRPLEAVIDDVTRPTLALYAGADLILAVRVPEELQPAVVRLARQVGASWALRAFKDEWCEAPELAGAQIWGGGWRGRDLRRR